MSSFEDKFQKSPPVMIPPNREKFNVYLDDCDFYKKGNNKYYGIPYCTKCQKYGHMSITHNFKRDNKKNNNL